MPKFTVVLRRPDAIADQEFKVDAYVALVKAKDRYAAVPAGQAEVFEADRRDFTDFNDFDLVPSDYDLVVVLEGHCNPILWSWSL